MKHLLVLIGLLLPTIASAQFFSPAPTPLPVIAAATTVATGAPLTVVVSNPDPSAYLIIKTTNEVATASLAVTVALDTDLGDQIVCSLTAITTNTTTLALLGNSQAAAGAVVDVCDFPVAGPLSLVFTVTGASAAFDIEADLHRVSASW